MTSTGSRRKRTWSALPDLLDVNVWVALSVDTHVHHARSLEYIENQAAEELVFCRTTELAVLRLLSNTAAFGQRALDGHATWNAVRTLIGAPGVSHVDEPRGAIDELLRAWSMELEIRGRQWSDAYLAAFATASGCRLVSFDADFARYPGLHWLHLEP